MNQPKAYKFQAEIWLYPGPGAWRFVTLPRNLSLELSDRYAGIKRGWGSLPVIVTVGKTTWQTSIFPDKKVGAYLLPIKKDVRKAEGIDLGQMVKIDISILTGGEK